ncbi:P-loop containing nucleoside triphosphate hydrolase protein [Phakopsora pachyrhizi]|uniref:DNA 3'-5' helicase n=1 Tax=Phakopsora pachyrhizi TaxID=170000 RepID=A0AAV0BJ93_PHAPC|nr:P-loop containing nucleoside triphosphate hydrolase protein [Phakopsora pachyrhizi]
MNQAHYNHSTRNSGPDPINLVGSEQRVVNPHSPSGNATINRPLTLTSNLNQIPGRPNQTSHPKPTGPIDSTKASNPTRVLNPFSNVTSALPVRGFVEPTLQEMDLETLYIKRHACVTRITVILQRMVNFLQTGECDTGEDYGCLEHTKSYLDERLGEFNAEVEHRKLNGNTLEKAASISPDMIIQSETPRRSVNLRPGSPPSTSSRASAENKNNKFNTSLVQEKPKIQAVTFQSSSTNRPTISTRNKSDMQRTVSQIYAMSLTLFMKLFNNPNPDGWKQNVETGIDAVDEPSADMAECPPAQLDEALPVVTDDLLAGIFSNDDVFEDSFNNGQSQEEEIQEQPDLTIDLTSTAGETSNRSEAPCQRPVSKENSKQVPAETSLTKIVEPLEDFSKKMQHPWSRDVGKALKNIFKLRGWRRNQLDAINATLSGQHCFILMPTGGGKSLCYQLPAVVRSGATRGVTIVLSPLISLITDQVQSLCEKGIGSAAFTGNMTAAERNSVVGDLRSSDPALCLIYVTPEMIMRSELFISILVDLKTRGLLARFVFDEAHCVSQWGHDFRPDYKDVGPKLRGQFRGIPFLALTATANHRVQQDVINNLGITGCKLLTQSFNRPNLRYEVRVKTKEVLNDIIRIIKVDHPNECGIIYCLSKKQCEDVAAHLKMKHGIRAHHYHAGMTKDDRQKVQHAWQKGVLQVISATIAFGMGIDKPDVRFVVHHSMPSSLEGYYQETGRAGRDGKISECVLFYSYKDFTTFLRMIEQGSSSREQVDRQLSNARQVVGFCLNKVDCRRSLVLSYFGEKFTPQQCGRTCDTCMKSEPTEVRDVTNLVRSAIKLVGQITRDKPVTMAHCIDVFKGSKNRKVLDAGHDLLEGAGAGQSLDRTDAERLFHMMVAKNMISERFESNAMGFMNAYVQLAPAHDSIYRNGEPIKLAFGNPVVSSKRNTDIADQSRTSGMKNSRMRKEAVAQPVQPDFGESSSDEEFKYSSEGVEIERSVNNRSSSKQVSRRGHPLRGAAKKAQEATKSQYGVSVKDLTQDDRVQGCYEEILAFIVSGRVDWIINFFGN